MLYIETAKPQRHESNHSRTLGSTGTFVGSVEGSTTVQLLEYQVHGQMFQAMTAFEVMDEYSKVAIALASYSFDGQWTESSFD